MVANPQTDKVTWYFAFCSQEENPYPFFGKFLKKGFGHVIVFSQAGPVVTAIEPSRTAVRITTYYNTEDANIPTNVENIAELFKKNDFKVIKHEYCYHISYTSLF
jgi:hypothetical protein